MGFFLHYSFLLCSIFSLLLPCLCWTGFKPEDLQSETRVMELFHQWKETHGKSYEDVDEEVNRFETFKKNMKYIAEANLSRRGYSVGLNRFSDMSNEEFRGKDLGNGGLSEWKKHTRSGSSLSLDWRKKGVATAVKDQGVSGCSWEYSLIGAIEGVNAIHTGEFSILSEQEHNVDHNELNHGNDESQSSNAIERVINNGGIGNEASIPQTEGGDGAYPTSKTINKFVSTDAFGYVEQTETALLCATHNQPISVGIDGSSIDFQLYTAGIYDGPCSSNPVDINHAVLIVGYGSEGGDDYWIVKNSWGTTWGMDGYIYIRRNTNLPYGVCAINALASYPLRTTLAASPSPSPSPSSVSPPPYDPPPQPSSSPPSPTPSYPTRPPRLPSPPPTPVPTPTYNPPTPSPPAPSQPPPPPAPSPPSPPPPSHKCGLLSFCLPGQTCCCLYKSFGFCLIQGCCDYSNAVCCPETDYCCPLEYPICDINAGLCLKNYDDNLGLDLKKKTWAKLTLPWSEYEEIREISYESLKWRRYGSAEVLRL